MALEDFKARLAELQKLRSQQDKLAHSLFATDRFCQSDIIKIIEQEVCNHFEVSKINLRSKGKTGDIVTAKHTLYYLCTVYTFYSELKIGKELMTSQVSVFRGKKRINELDTRYKQDMILYMAVENMKENIEKILMKNLMPKLENETTQNQK